MRPRQRTPKMSTITWVLAMMLPLAGCHHNTTPLQGHTLLDQTYIVAKTTGTIVSLTVHQGQHVMPDQRVFAQNASPWRMFANLSHHQALAAQALWRDRTVGKRQTYLAQRQAAVQQSQSAMWLAKQTSQRADALHKANLNTAENTDQARSSRQQQQANWQYAQAQLAAAQLPARPHTLQGLQHQHQARAAYAKKQAWQLQQVVHHAGIQGHIGNIYAKTGDRVHAFQPILTIVQPIASRIAVDAPPATIAKLHLGQTLSYCVLPCQHIWHPATLVRIADHSRYTPDLFYDAAHRSALAFRLILHIPQPTQLALKPGQPVWVKADPS